MRRHDFIKAIAGSATTWPLAAGAQQPGQPHNYAARAIASVTSDGAQRHYLVRFPRVSLIPTDGFVAMLLKCDFDSAKTRGHLFGRCPEFAKKRTLVERTRWFEEPQLQSCLVSVVADA
jgi:hypothetical protein